MPTETTVITSLPPELQSYKGVRVLFGVLAVLAIVLTVVSNALVISGLFTVAGMRICALVSTISLGLTPLFHRWAQPPRVRVMRVKQP